MSDETPPKPKSPVEQLAELLRAVLWPLFAFVVLLAFWTPLRDLAKALPALVDKSESITIGDVSLKISKDSLAKMPPDVRKALSGIPAEAIRFLLRDAAMIKLSKTQLEQIRPEARMVIDELVKRGLIEPIPALSEMNGVVYQPTALGKRAIASLVDVFVAPFSAVTS